MYDAAVVGSGPNGLTAALRLAEAGQRVIVLEGAATIGGGTRTESWTLPGFRHDVCSAVHPLGAGSPYWTKIDLDVTWLHAELALAHPLENQTAATLSRQLDDTAAALGPDAGPYRYLVGGLVESWQEVSAGILGPLLRVPRHPLALAKFGISGIQSAAALAKRFQTERAKALLGGNAAHGVLPLDRPFTGSFAMLLAALAHVRGWPVAKGGSQAIADALAERLLAKGGEVQTDSLVHRWSDIPQAASVLFDTAPSAMADIAGARLPKRYAKRLRQYQHGPGACKVDFALSQPVPWVDPACSKAGTVHVGGTFDEIATAEATVADGLHPKRPFVLVAQPSLIDPTRAPAGKHVLWAYSHVPAGSDRDVSENIINQIERFAPGFRTTILATKVTTATDFAAYNPNYVGGDFSGGAHSAKQLIFRPTLGTNPYATPSDNIYLCSASTPPGAGVHGMCGYWAAETVLKRT